MLKKLAVFFATPLLLLATASNTFAATEIMSISDITIKEKSENTTSTTVSFEGSHIQTDAILARRNSFISYEITLTNNAKQSYKISNVEDSLSGDVIKSSYDFGSDFVKSGQTINLIATYSYQTGQDSDSDEPILLDDITITLTLVDENNNTIAGPTNQPEAPETSETSEASSTNPFTGDRIAAFIAIFASSVAALFCLFKKHPKIAASLACLACTITIGAVFITNTNAAEAKTVKLYLHGLSIMPKAAPHVVYFDANSGLGNMEPQNFELDTPQNLSTNTFTRNYFDFAEWNTEPDGSGESYADGTSLNFAESGETTLYAQWATDHAVAFLDTGSVINKKLKQLAGVNVPETASLVNVKLSGIYSVYKAESLPENFDTENDANIISTPESPFKVFAWKNGSNFYIYSEAEVIKGNKDMANTFVNFYTTSSYPAIADWDMSETEKFTYMFAVNNSKSAYNELANWDTSSAKTFSSMFYRNFNLYTVEGLAKWNTSNVTNLAFMFYWTNLASDYLSNIATTDRGDYTSWDVSNVTNLNYTFGGIDNSHFKNLNGIANWNTSNVTTLVSTFAGSDNLSDLSALTTTDRGDYTSWDVSNVTSMAEIFESCKYLRSLAGIENWDVSNVTNLSRAFYEDKNLQDISALANWNISNVTNLSNIFNNNIKLTDISPLANWDTSNVTDMSGVFSYAQTLADITPIAKWNTSSATTISSFLANTAITNVDALTTTDRGDYTSWDVSNIQSFSGAFSQASKLTDISGIANWNTSNATSIASTFYATAITNVDALATTDRGDYTSWDVSNVTDFSRTFYEIPTLTDINGIVNWNVGKAKYFDRTFNGDSGLTYVRMLDAWQPPADAVCTYVFHGTSTNNWPAWAD